MNFFTDRPDCTTRQKNFGFPVPVGVPVKAPKFKWIDEFENLEGTISFDDGNEVWIE